MKPEYKALIETLIDQGHITPDNYDDCEPEYSLFAKRVLGKHYLENEGRQYWADHWDNIMGESMPWAVMYMTSYDNFAEFALKRITELLALDAFDNMEEIDHEEVSDMLRENPKISEYLAEKETERAEFLREQEFDRRGGQ